MATAIEARLNKIEGLIRVLLTKVTTSGGSGDVVGPGSATDDVLAVFNGVTGKLIKNSAIDKDVVVTLTGTQTLTGKSIAETQLTFTDITTNNASASAHGFVPKWPNNTTTFFRGDGTFAAPAGGGDNISNISFVNKSDASFTTTSGTFVDVTGLSITVTTGANRVLLMSSFSTEISTASYECFTFDIDGTDVGGSNGLFRHQLPNANQPIAVCMYYLTNTLSAASHTFKVNMFAASGYTGKIIASTTDSHALFFAVELID